MIESESLVRVRYVETDAGGAVHHSSFIPWLELARIDLVDNQGLTYAEIEKLGVHAAVLEVHIKIFKPAYFDDRLVIKTWMKNCPKVRHVFEYKIFREGTLLATAETVHAFVNNQKKLVKPPVAFMKIMNAHFDL